MQNLHAITIGVGYRVDRLFMLHMTTLCLPSRVVENSDEYQEYQRNVGRLHKLTPDYDITLNEHTELKWPARFPSDRFYKAMAKY